MIEKTRGIVLHQVKFTDSGIIVHFFTREFGRISILVKGMRKKKSGKSPSLFQPLSILDLEFYNKASREVQLLKESSSATALYSIHADIKKSVVALFLGEVLSSVLFEENPHPALFDYIEKSVIWFDENNEKYSNFHISFLCGLSSFLGFEPTNRKNPEEGFFDMLNGRFLVVPPTHNEFSSGVNADMLNAFFGSSIDDAAGITMSGKIRNEILETIVRYYTLHLPALRKINSLEVLKEVFG
ncbi:MAG TPA: DNA repair protein RecO [Bacteroidales bacterium]|nr:DNA repair protein RecO [Bacteroidales bacterium]